MDDQVYRKVSMERISSPEQLDSLMRVTSPIGWLALAAVAMIIVSALIWGVWGSIPTTVNGNGILVKSGGVFDIVAGTNGQIYDLRIRPGDAVAAGQVIARVNQSDLVSQIGTAKKDLDTTLRQYKDIRNNIRNSAHLNTKSIEMQKSALRKRIADTRKQLSWLESRIKDQQALLADGLLTRQELVATKQQQLAAESDIRQYENQIEQLSVQKLNSENSNQEKLLSLEQQITEKESALAALQSRYDASAVVVSPFSGQVLSVMQGIGSFVRSDTPIISISQTGKNIRNLTAIIYVTSADAKLIQPGMNVQISPADAQKDEFGYIQGSVHYISKFPVSPEEMMNTLENKALVDMLSRNGPPLKVQVDLVPSQDTASGIKWSTPRGSKVIVTEGTMATAMFIVQEQRPISLVIPLFKKYFYGT